MWLLVSVIFAVVAKKAHVPVVLCAKLLLTNKANQALTNAPRIMIMVDSCEALKKLHRGHKKERERESAGYLQQVSYVVCLCLCCGRHKAQFMPHK